MFQITTTERLTERDHPGRRRCVEYNIICLFLFRVERFAYLFCCQTDARERERDSNTTDTLLSYGEDMKSKQELRRTNHGSKIECVCCVCVWVSFHFSPSSWRSITPSAGRRSKPQLHGEGSQRMELIFDYRLRKMKK